MLSLIATGLTGLISIAGGVMAWVTFRRAANNTPAMKSNAIAERDTQERQQVVSDIEKGDTTAFQEDIGS